MIHLEQGDSDSLCVYYSAAMLLLALYPRYIGQIFTSANADPIIKHIKPPGTQSHDKMISKWLFNGMDPSRIVHALNRLAKADGLAFQIKREERNKVDSTFLDIKKDIDQGLPVLLCHNSPSLGHHAVVVDGYQIERQRTANPIYWLRLCDPGGDDVRQWDQLTTLSNGRLDLVRVTPRDELPRPDRCTTIADKKSSIESQLRERYWFKDGAWGWFDAEKLFDQIVPKAL